MTSDGSSPHCGGHPSTFILHPSAWVVDRPGSRHSSLVTGFESLAPPDSQARLRQLIPDVFGHALVRHLGAVDRALAVGCDAFRHIFLVRFRAHGGDM